MINLNIKMVMTNIFPNQFLMFIDNPLTLKVICIKKG